MNRKQFAVLLILAVVAAFAGGAISQVVMGQGAAIAENSIPKVIQSERFEVVDSEGKKRGLFGLVDETPVLWLIDTPQSSFMLTLGPLPSLSLRGDKPSIEISGITANISLTSSERSDLAMFDEKGNKRCFMRANNSEGREAGFGFFRNKSETTDDFYGVFGLTPEGRGQLLLRYNDGQSTWMAP
jgi:hypothetical protein